MSIQNVKETLNRYIKETRLLSWAMPVSMVFLFIYPAFSLLGSIFPLFNYGPISKLLYFAFVFGVILCFSKDERLYLGIGFGVMGLSGFVSFIRACVPIFGYVSVSNIINSLVSFAVYGLLCWLCLSSAKEFKSAVSQFRERAAQNAQNAQPPQYQAPGQAPRYARFCSQCGAGMAAEDNFCLRCGARAQTPAGK